MYLNIIPGLNENNNTLLCYTVITGSDVHSNLSMEQAIGMASQYIETNDGAVEQITTNLKLGVDVNLLAKGEDIGIYILAGVRSD